MPDAPRVGLLPLYLKLYDDVQPEARPEMEGFADRVAERLRGAGLDVLRGETACVRCEVERTVRRLMEHDPDLLATLHLAYSPSLEAVDTLTHTQIPLLLLDTTPKPDFGEDADGDDMFANHGIHGVQDLACMMRRNGRQYRLAVGHIDDPAFLAEVGLVARAARATHAMRTMRVVVFGDPFPGMGDFTVTAESLRARLGVQVHPVTVAALALRTRDISDEEVATEAIADAQACDISGISRPALDRTNRVGLALRRLVEELDGGAMSFNFESFVAEAGVETVPFLEASKAMARGVGYAGEADALTAALIGALAQGGCTATFTEMFCPDWAGDTIFMSHMGECGLHLAAESPKLVEKPYQFSDVANPVIAVFKLRPGPATLINLAPGPHNSFGLIAARVEVLDRGPVAGFPDVPHYWLRPVDHDLPSFLRHYSELGGTHHLALCLGDEVEFARTFAELLGIDFSVV